MKRALVRIAHQIVEKNGGAERLVLVGIVARGPVLASRIADVIEAVEGIRVPVGKLDITFHRDDLALRKPHVSDISDVPVPVDGETIVLVDDVLFTGRTIRAALDELVDFGRPRAVQLACLVDRGHRELPIRADFVGKNIPTALDEEVLVRVSEVDGADAVTVGKADSAAANGAG